MLTIRELSLLVDFATVCRTRNISLAASELNTVQSAVTQRMRRLEDACGTKLFDRHSRGVTPTDQGFLLLEQAEKLSTLLYETNRKMTDFLQSPSGTVTIGLPPSVTPVLVTPLIEAFSNSLPNVELSLTEAMSGYLEGWLANGETDFAMVFQRPRQAALTATPLLDEELYFLVSPERAKALPEAVTIHDIAQVPLVAPSRMHSTRYMLETAASEAGVSLRILSIDSGHQLIRHGILGNCGMVLSRSAAAPELASGSLVALPIISPRFSRTVYLVERQGAQASHLLKMAKSQICRTILEIVMQDVWKGRPRGALSDLSQGDLLNNELP